jgi:hypothetical protein
VQAPTKSELIVNLKTAKALHISRFRQITGFSLSQEIATHAAKGALSSPNEPLRKL